MWNVCWQNVSAKLDNQPDLMKHFGVMALELAKFVKINHVRSLTWIFFNGSSSNLVTLFENKPHCLKSLGIMALDLSKTVQIRLVLKLYDNVCGYNILPKFVKQLIASSTQIIQIDSRHLLFYYMPISLVYYYTGVLCDIWTLLFNYSWIVWLWYN